MILKPAELVLLSFYVLFLMVALSFACMAFWRLNIHYFSPDLDQAYADAFTELPGNRNYVELNGNAYLSLIARNRNRFQKNMAEKQLESDIQRSLSASVDYFSDRTPSTLVVDPMPSLDSTNSPHEITIPSSCRPPTGPKWLSTQSQKEQIDQRSISIAISGTVLSLQSSKKPIVSGIDYSSLHARDWPSEAHIKNP